MKPHDILRVKIDADLETIKRAYVKLAKTTHPDAGGSKDDFVRLHAAYEAMVEHCKTAATSQQQGPAEEDHGKSAEGPSLDEIMREVRERLDQEFAQRGSLWPRRASSTAASFWYAVVLTPICVVAVATCFCYDGKPMDRPLWSYSFAIALGVVLYIGGLSAVIGSTMGTSGMTIYWRMIVLTAIVVALMTLPPTSLVESHGWPRPIVYRHHIPTWWPVR